MSESITLRVDEALQMDVGRGVARLPTEALDRLGVRAGDVVEIKGKSRAVATVWRGRPDDGNVIKIDATIRSNANTSLGSEVEVRKVAFHNAQSITIAPTQELDPRVHQIIANQRGFLHKAFVDKPVMKGQIIPIGLMGTRLQYVITQTAPKGCVKVTPQTQISVSDTPAKAEGAGIPEVSYEDIGGLDKEIQTVREMVELPMKHPEVFERLGIGAPKGVLLTGPPGTGKTLLAKAVASETESHFYPIAGPEIINKFYGESEKQLRQIFEEAEKNAPSIIFIDEIDSIAPKRGESRGEVEKRVVSQLLTMMDGLKGRGQVVVMAATNRPDDIDEALRRPGRFDRELRINPPNEKGRRAIVRIHTRGVPVAKDVDMDELASRTIGFTGADLEALVKEAAMRSLKNWLPDLQQHEMTVPANVLEKIEVRMTHFNEALKLVEPSALREVMITRPKTRWSDVGGLDQIKLELREAVELPLKSPELFEQGGIRPPKGILLHGTPGTGKTLLAKAVANESNANFISVKGPELISKWVGESEKRIREIFRKARQVAPTVIFFDEFDAISKVRGSSMTDSTERMVNQLLTELDGIEELEQVTVIAATNRPDLIDPALLRPGRIELDIEIPLPDEAQRREILAVHAEGKPLAKEIDLDGIAKRTDSWSGAELEFLLKRAALQAIRAVTQGKAKKVLVNAKLLNDVFAELSSKRERKGEHKAYYTG